MRAGARAVQLGRLRDQEQERALLIQERDGESGRLRGAPAGPPRVSGLSGSGTAIVEVAVHETFEVLDTVPHVLTCAGLLSTHPFVLIPSAVSRSSWNRIVSPSDAAGRYQLLEQEAFALDTHLHRR